MKKVTLALDEKTAAWTSRQAAKLNVSVSRFVDELLRERIRHSHDYEGAMQRFLAGRASASAAFDSRFIRTPLPA